MAAPGEIVHASAVALSPERGVLILGPSGSGKSSLALRLMAFGAHLVADDRVELRIADGGLVGGCPAPLSGLIEARGVGILRAKPLAQARICLVVDLGQEEPERLPPSREIALLGISLPLVLRVQHGHLDVAVLQWLRHGRAM